MEAGKTDAAAIKLKSGMVIAQDALGTYTPPLKTKNSFEKEQAGRRSC